MTYDEIKAKMCLKPTETEILCKLKYRWQLHYLIVFYGAVV